MTDAITASAPDRPHRLRRNCREARIAVTLGLGEDRKSRNIWNHGTTTYAPGGIFLTDAELATLQETIGDRSVRTAAQQILPLPPERPGDTIRPPHDGEKKARASYRLLLEEHAALGHALTTEVRLAAWQRARGFYGLTNTRPLPSIEVADSHAAVIAALATSRESDETSGETEWERNKRLTRKSRARKNLSRGLPVGGER